MSENKMSEEENSLLLEHEFDGIQELDNPPPPWLMYMFYISVIFSAVYWVHYHTFGQGILQDEEYALEMKAAEDEAKKANANGEKAKVWELITDEAALTAGAEIYVKSNCAACHGKLAEGNQVGPNLTDEYWINGGSFGDVFKIIKFGVLTKGMTPFKDQIDDESIAQVASHLLHSLQGTNPANAREPQGEKFVAK